MKRNEQRLDGPGGEQPSPPVGEQQQLARTVARQCTDAQVHLELLMPADTAVPGWRGLDPEQRWNWFQALYEQAAHLDRRYRLGLRSGWWEDDVQVEILATLGAWVAMFDYANWTDPEGKARLILQLPSVRELVRGGAQQFDPQRDREAFERHLRADVGCQESDDVR